MSRNLFLISDKLQRSSQNPCLNLNAIVCLCLHLNVSIWNMKYLSVSGKYLSVSSI